MDVGRRPLRLPISRRKLFLVIVLILCFTAIFVDVVLISTRKPSNREFVVEIRQFDYNPRILNVFLGDTVTIRLRAMDISQGMWILGYDVNLQLILKEGAPREVSTTFIADKPGVYRFYCSVPGGGPFNPFEIGYLVVNPNIPFISSSALVIVMGAAAIFLYKSNGGKAGVVKKRVWKFDLFRIKIIKWLVKLRSFQFIIVWPTLLIFMVIVFTGFYGTQSGNKNFGLLTVWILWWSVLMMVMVPIGGRIWCAMCPIPSLGEWLSRGAFVRKGNRGLCLNKRWPKKLDNIWLQNISFLIVSSFMGILITRPWATAIMIVALMLLAFVMHIIFERRAFCRYVCPVSGFVGLYSNFSMLELRVKDRDVCIEHVADEKRVRSAVLKSEARSGEEGRVKRHDESLEHGGVDCYAGNDKGYGCPWFEFPKNLDRNTYCGLCMECVKTCPRDNIALNLRLGGEDLYIDPQHGAKKRGLDEAFKAHIMLALAFLYGVIFGGPNEWTNPLGKIPLANFLGPFPTIRPEIYLPKWDNAVKFAILVFGSALLIMPAIHLIFIALSKVTSDSKDVPLHTLFINYSYALIPYGLFAWIAFSLNILLVQGSKMVSVLSDPAGWGWDLFGTRYYSWSPLLSIFLPYLQIAVLLLGLTLSLRAASEISRRTFPSDKQAFRGYIPIVVMLMLTTIAFLSLWVGGFY